MSDYAFYLSYARLDRDGHLEKFFKDLAFAVRREVPLPDKTLQDVCFYDDRSISAGEQWDDALVDGLQTARSFVALLSPGYVNSRSCGREVTVFRDRLARHLGTGGGASALLLPIMWDQPSQFEVPAALSKYQRTNADLGTTYAEHGLRYLAKRAPRKYSDVVDALAALLARSIRCSAVPALDPPPHWETTPSAFDDIRERTADRPHCVAPTKERVTRDFSEVERAAIPDQLAAVFAPAQFELDPTSLIHEGEFALVYGAQLDGEHVAIKVVPTNALRKRVERIMTFAQEAHEKLGGTSFVQVRKVLANEPEAKAVVMDYAPWPTLDGLMHARGRLDPTAVAALLARVCDVQNQAHKRGVPLGALSPLSIFVDEPNEEVHLSPFRIEAHLARELTLGDDQVVSQDVLEMVTPEVYEGWSPTTRQELDAHGQYYLGLLGLELLLGRRPVTISCLKDLHKKEAFFKNPRRYFEPPGCTPWADEAPGLAFVLATLLARRPGDRMESADAVSENLRQVASGRLPDVVRQCVGADYAVMTQQRNGCFAQKFYDRLFLDDGMKAMFRGSDPDLHSRFADALQNLVEFPENAQAPRFRRLARKHATIPGMTRDTADAFRRAFVAEVVNSDPSNSPAISPAMRGDAWNAALRLGITALMSYSEDADETSVASAADDAAPREPSVTGRAGRLHARPARGPTRQEDEGMRGR